MAIARGFDYYTGFIFECVYNTKLFGSIGGGGRYDNLVEVYGGQPTPATGFSIGFERVIALLNLLENFSPPSFLPKLDFFIVPVDSSCVSSAISITQMLRANGKNVEMDLLGRKVKIQFGIASKMSAKWVVVIGPDELDKNQVTIKNLMTGEEKSVHIKDLMDY